MYIVNSMQAHSLQTAHLDLPQEVEVSAILTPVFRAANYQYMHHVLTHTSLPHLIMRGEWMLLLWWLYICHGGCQCLLEALAGDHSPLPRHCPYLLTSLGYLLPL